MWKCIKCGKENNDDRNHCWSCEMVKDAPSTENPSTTQKVELSGVIDRPTSCSKCSAPLDEDAKFCPSCATPVLLNTPLNCPKCGKSVNAGVRFCKYCAADLMQREYRSLSGINGLLADKYHAMSDSQLLAMLRGDLSGQTERSLSIALAELETRTNIDWRDLSVAKTRVKEAIVSAHSHSSAGSYRTNSSYDASQDLAREKAERLAKAGGITAGISAILFFWGYSYTSSFANSGRAAIMNLAGQTDSTYQLASLCLFLGAIGFLVGLILFIVGMAQRTS